MARAHQQHWKAFQVTPLQLERPQLHILTVSSISSLDVLPPQAENPRREPSSLSLRWFLTSRKRTHLNRLTRAAKFPPSSPRKVAMAHSSLQSRRATPHPTSKTTRSKAHSWNASASVSCPCTRHA
ncbi:hypothetical protein BC827DRAFT_454791 [Russula dissimulans]|nr:hypothetical protein BC827DRAFT_454791 [Russula dissimulans]